MAVTLTFEVGGIDAGQRIDKVVTRLLIEHGHATTRSEVQRWIVEGRVCIDGQPVAKKTSLEEGQRLSIEPAAPLASDATPDPTVVLDVVFEDEHLLVIAKPAGLVVHPARGHRQGTLVNGLLARPGFHLPDAADDEEAHRRPGIVHRLDKDTSGLLVVAKTAPCREGLKALFASHTIERSYLALAIGAVSGARFDTPYGRHRKSRMRFTSLLDPDRDGVKRARTHVTPIQRVGGCTLVRCRLHTGRTHQIRVHMLEQANAPLLGDKLYKRQLNDPRIAAIADTLGRQALHAEVLGFVHPITGEAMRWEMPLPDDMQAALDALTLLNR